MVFIAFINVYITFITSLYTNLKLVWPVFKLEGHKMSIWVFFFCIWMIIIIQTSSKSSGQDLFILKQEKFGLFIWHSQQHCLFYWNPDVWCGFFILVEDWFFTFRGVLEARGFICSLVSVQCLQCSRQFANCLVA